MRSSERRSGPAVYWDSLQQSDAEIAHAIYETVCGIDRTIPAGEWRTANGKWTSHDKRQTHAIIERAVKKGRFVKGERHFGDASYCDLIRVMQIKQTKCSSFLQISFVTGMHLKPSVHKGFRALNHVIVTHIEERPGDRTSSPDTDVQNFRELIDVWPAERGFILDLPALGLLEVAALSSGVPSNKLHPRPGWSNLLRPADVEKIVPPSCVNVEQMPRGALWTATCDWTDPVTPEALTQLTEIDRALEPLREPFRPTV